jgi:hypothetical protein
VVLSQSQKRARHALNDSIAIAKRFNVTITQQRRPRQLVKVQQDRRGEDDSGFVAIQRKRKARPQSLGTAQRK